MDILKWQSYLSFATFYITDRFEGRKLVLSPTHRYFTIIADTITHHHYTQSSLTLYFYVIMREDHFDDFPFFANL